MSQDCRTNGLCGFQQRISQIWASPATRDPLASRLPQGVQMADRVLKAITSSDGRHRVLIVQRADGAFSVRRHWLTEAPQEEGWGQMGPYPGVYDSPETAESEAFARIQWPEAS